MPKQPPPTLPRSAQGRRSVEHKIIRGEGAGKWLPFARQKVAQLHRRADGDALTQRWTVDGGMVKIAVRVVGDQRYIHIERKGCPPFLSGLCDLMLHKEGDVLEAGVPLTPVYQVPDPDNPEDEEATIDVFRRFYPSLATPEEDRAWRDEPGLARDWDAAKQMIELKASMFSGEMRKVVQVLQGMNVYVPYSPAWGPTHGVFKASGGSRWIIEIANEGILAWPMSTCRNPILDGDGAVLLDYTPIATPRLTGAAFGAALANGSIITLAGPDEMRDAYSRIPFFTNCGWAFNSDGHEAANAVWHMEGEYVQSAVYVVNITEVEGKPATATVTRGQEGFIHGPDGLCHLKFPLGLRRQLYSFDTTPGDPVYLHSSNGPVFVFYDGDARVVVRYVHDLAASHTDVFGDDLSVPDGCVSHDVFGTLRRDGTETYLALPHLEGDDIPAAGTYLSASSLNTLDIGVPAFKGCAFLNVNNTQYGYVYDLYQVTFDGRFGVADSEVALSALVIPLWEREGYYYAQLIRRATLVGSTRHQSEPCYDATLQQAEMVDPGGIFGGRCGTLNDTTEVTGLTGESTPSPCVAGQWRVRLTPAQIGTHKFLPGVSAGSSFVAEARDTFGTCVLQGTPIPPSEDTFLPGSDYRVPVQTFLFRGSGGVRRTLPTPTGERYLVQESGFETAMFRFINQETQLMTVLRDAFDPRKLAISPGMNLTLGADLLSDLEMYPVEEAVANYTLVGIA